MSERLTRKEMKTDEVREAFDHSLVWAGEHWRQLCIGLAGLILLAGAFGAFLLYRGSRAEAGAEALVEADRIAGAEIDVTAADPTNEERPTFASESERDAATRERLAEVIERFGGTPAGDAARARLGELEMRAGNAARARELWQTVADGGEDALRATVELSLISLDREEGQLEALASRLQGQVETGDGALPQDAILFELATTLEALGRAEEAEATLQQLVDDHPASPYGLRAQRKLVAGS
jgi:tetratricopeptide (TPR) repeat protein